jgi:hypothetical protein
LAETELVSDRVVNFPAAAVPVPIAEGEAQLISAFGRALVLKLGAELDPLALPNQLVAEALDREKLRACADMLAANKGDKPLTELTVVEGSCDAVAEPLRFEKAGCTNDGAALDPVLLPQKAFAETELVSERVVKVPAAGVLEPIAPGADQLG